MSNQAIKELRRTIRSLPSGYPGLPGHLNELGNMLYNRYISRGSVANLEESIQIGQEVLTLAPPNHQHRAGFLIDLASRLSERFTRTGDIADLDNATTLEQQALDITPIGDLNRAQILNNLASSFFDRYNSTAEEADLEKAIEAQDKALDSTPHDHPKRAVRLSTSSVYQFQIYSNTNNLVYLEQSICLARSAVGMIPPDHPDYAYCATNLTDNIGERYRLYESSIDLEEMIHSGRVVMASNSEEHTEYASYLATLSNSLQLRFSKTGDKSDLLESIQLDQKAISATAHDHPDFRNRLAHLSRHLSVLASLNSQGAVVDESIELAKTAIEKTLADSIGWAESLDNYANWLYNRHLETGSESDLEESVKAGAQSLLATLPTSSTRITYMSNQANRLHTQYTIRGDSDTLELSVQLAREVVASTVLDHSQLAVRLKNLASFLRTHYDHNGEASYLDESIQLINKSITLIPPDHVQRVDYLDDLAVALGDRFLLTGIQADLEERVRLAREVIELSTENDPNFLIYLGNLADALNDRHGVTGDVTDLEESIQIQREVVEKTPTDDASLGGALLNLSVFLGHLFPINEDLEDLQESVDIGRQALEEIPTHHPSHVNCLSNLSNNLENLYAGTEDIDVLDEGIELRREALSLTEKDDKLLRSRIRDLSASLGFRYSVIGNLEDLEQAIELQRAVIDDETVISHGPEQWSFLATFAGHLRDRYLKVGIMADLDEAIRVQNEVIRLCLPDYPTLGDWVQDLSIFLSQRYSRTNRISDLDESIALAETARTLPAPHYLDESIRADNLSAQLHKRYLHEKNIDDLHKAIQLSRDAVRPGSRGSFWGSLLRRLGENLKDLFLESHVAKDLEEAIGVVEEACQSIDQDHPYAATFFGDLGELLHRRYLSTSNPVDLENAKEYFEKALKCPNSQPIQRIGAGRKLTELCSETFDWDKAFHTSAIILSLVPQLALKALSHSDKQYLLSQVSGLSSDAAAIALESGKEASTALGFLETGRCALSTSIEDVRADIQDLQDNHPELAEKLNHVRQKLDLPVASSITAKDLHSWDHGSHERYQMGKEFDKVLADIRGQPGFERFLLEPEESAIRDAALDGPIVVVNTSSYRCDAIVVEPHQIWSIPLPKLRASYLETEERNVGNYQNLVWLWDTIAHPILDSLGFIRPPEESQWPRIWWILTGLLSKFPIHAAGRHSLLSNETVLDKTMSSYTPSIKTLIYSRHRPLANSESPEAVLVAMNSTPGHRSLPSAAEEVENVQDLCESMGLHPNKLSPPRKEDIIASLPQCKIFHFAGHGDMQDDDVLNAALLLHDWETDPLTISCLLDMNLRKYSPFLAYLSACGTGQVKERKSMDENIHLIMGFQLAGFRHVIGTLWEVKDAFCVKMAKMTYEGIRDHGMKDKSICWGLHNAVRQLRSEWLQEPTRQGHPIEAVKDQEMPAAEIKDDGEASRKGFMDEDDFQPLAWVPYIHYGV